MVCTKIKAAAEADLTANSGSYLRRTSLSWLAVQMVSSRAQDSRALVWSWLIWGLTEGLVPSALA